MGAALIPRTLCVLTFLFSSLFFFLFLSIIEEYQTQEHWLYRDSRTLYVSSFWASSVPIIFFNSSFKKGRYVFAGDDYFTVTIIMSRQIITDCVANGYREIFKVLSP